MEFDEKIPIYIQIIDLIKKEIVKGKIKRGDKLPSVRDLAEELKVNPNTVQKAYQELEREGIIYTLRGTGSFVVEDENKILGLREAMAKEILERFVKEMKDLNFSKEEMFKLLTSFLEEEKNGNS
ncbi:MAG: GntR family transcriptional regulator [Dictyoglomus sp. NZ13-RE01]|nr:MAG: GntR family transcriptional regulator [Dictyoglomus sp. NZ13-RE01]